MKRFETIEHTADTGIRSFGATEEEAFENAAAGMFAILAEPGGVEEKERFDICVAAADRETLLVEWLNELLYVYDSRGVLLSRFHVTELGETHMCAEAWGEEIDPQRHSLGLDIKAVTYHMLKVVHTPDGWETDVIFDV